MDRKALLAFLFLLLMACESPAGAVVPLSPKERLRVATTTSLYDTGLWSYLEPMFEDKYDVELDIIYAGTGIALEYGRRGDVDVLTIHDREREDRFLAEGYGINRRCIAYNYFLIVGPRADPAAIKGLSPVEAMKRLFKVGRADPGRVKFVSRGDNSGTHAREKKLWEKAGFDYEEIRGSGKWYIESGRGMGPTLLMAQELSAYTISDLGTYLVFKRKRGLKLEPLVDKGEGLLNVYAALAVNPDKHPEKKINIRMANNLINFLMSEEIQDLIGKYGLKEYGRPLFIPIAGGKCREVGCPTWQECSLPATYPPRRE